jgi:hypothetical protein
MFFDDLPIWGFIGKVEKLLRPGEKPELRFYLFTHIHFDIHYNEDRVIEARGARKPRVALTRRGAMHQTWRLLSCRPACVCCDRTQKACRAASAAGPARGARAHRASAGEGSGAVRHREGGVEGRSRVGLLAPSPGRGACQLSSPR